MTLTAEGEVLHKMSTDILSRTEQTENIMKDLGREDYRKSISRLKEKKVDVFIGNHVWNNDTENKGEILRKTGENKFIDSDIWCGFLSCCEKRLDEVIAKDDNL